MNVNHIVQFGAALALAGLAGCDGRPAQEPMPPVTQAIASTAGSKPAAVLSSGTESAPSDALPAEPAATERPHKGGPFGVGIRPGHGASGIVP